MNDLIKIENKLFLKEDVLISFEYNIITFLQLNNKIIIVVDIPKNKSDHNQNVYCINTSGDKLWQLEYQEYPTDNCPINNVYEEMNSVKTYRWCGIEEVIDINSGKIISCELIK